MEFMGKVPPHNLEAEQNLLGSMMLSKESVINAISILTPGDFYKQSHEVIFESILDLFNANDPVDQVSVMDRLVSKSKLHECGGLEYLMELTDKGILTQNTLHYAKIILESANRRRIIKSCTEGVQMAYSNEDSELVKLNVVDGLMRIEKKTGSIVTLSDAVVDAYKDIENDYEGISNTIKTGFRDLDTLVGGVAPGDMCLVAARPSMGKSALALAFGNNATKRGLVGIYFSFEMPRHKLAKRLIFSDSMISNNKVKSRAMENHDWMDLTKTCSQLSNQKLYIDDRRSNTMIDIKSKCYEVKRENDGKLDFVIIDHLGIVKPNNENDTRNRQISQISNDFKTLCMELNVAGFALNQLNRGVETRENKRPVMSDLKDSGTLEEDADIIMFLYRDEYYYPDSEKAGIAEVITAKSRDGKIGTTELCWIGKYTKFADLQRV